MKICLITVFFFFFYFVRVKTDSGKIDSSIMTTQSTDVATTESYRQSRAYRRGEDHNHNHDHDHGEEEEEEDNLADMDQMDVDEDMGSKSLAEPKGGEYWGGYYDFLINEGSYKFWAVFQLATAALLIYSGFAALYYAKVNPSTTDDYEDYFLRRRKRHISDTLFKLDEATFQRIIDALELNIH